MRLFLILAFSCLVAAFGAANAGLIGNVHVKVPRTCGPHSPPTPATAIVNMSCETFFDGPFDLGRIDRSDTGNCTYDCRWYTHNKWPAFPGGTSQITSPNCGTCIWDFGNNSATPSGDYSVNGSSSLVLAPVSDTPYSHMPVMMASARYSTTIAQGYQGMVFQMPFYVEFVVPTVTTTCSAEPCAIIWAVPLEFLNAGNGAAYNFSELDLCEFPFGCGCEHQWGGTGSGVSAIDNAVCIGAAQSGTTNRIGLEIVDPAHNGGTIGFQKTFINDVDQNNDQDIQWQAGAGSSPAATPSNPNGTFNHSNAHSFVLFMGAGASKNMTVQQIRVWQLVGANGVALGRGGLMAGELPR